MTGGRATGERTKLSTRDALAVLDAVREATDAPDLDELAGIVAASVRRLVPSNGSGYNEVDPSVPRIVYGTDPIDFVGEDFGEHWTRLAHQHPIFTHQQRTGDGSTHTISDFLSRREYRELELYRELYGPSGIEYQIAFGLPAPQPLVRLYRTRPRRPGDVPPPPHAGVPNRAHAGRTARRHREHRRHVRS